MIRSRVNQYHGINPHLQSRLQHVYAPDEIRDGDSWQSFHASHVADFANFLNQHLPEGYRARAEQSLQIKYEIPGSDRFIKETRYPRPDVSIWRTGYSDETEGIAVAEMFAPDEILEDLEENLPASLEVFPKAVVIYSPENEPITRIELLSPANKPPHGSAYAAYQKARENAVYTLQQAVIELDYLHESYPPFNHLPIYPQAENAHPYHVVIFNPRQRKELGQIHIYHMDVDQILPVIGVPLRQDKLMPFNLDVVYQFTYQTGRWGATVDYSVLPERLETYSPADRERIQQRMALIKTALDKGLDLESAPFTAEQLA